jgi:hypothetical protein
MRKTTVEVNLGVLRELQRDAARYRFLRDEDNWGEDSGSDCFDALSNSSMCAFDEIIDSRLEKSGLELS